MLRFAEELEKRNSLVPANSIKMGRLVPPIVYYYAYFRLVEQGNVAWGQPVDFCDADRKTLAISSGLLCRSRWACL